ncbi:MAG: hypothetical protein FJ189_00490 [Gammaproteobacteria bacterium]|nr:hypothetical protein [Gammaproteobacteria bacterium]
MDWMRKALGHKFEEPMSILTSVAGSLASAVLINMFSSDDEDEAPTVASKPEVMPEADDEAARKARREAIYRRIAGQGNQGGRASTVMTDEDGGTTLG